MSYLWLIENPHLDREGTLKALQGNYPIQAFASIDSFRKVLPTISTLDSKPDALLVNTESLAGTFATIYEELETLLPNIRKIYLCHDIEYDYKTISKTLVVPSSIDSFSLITYLRSFLDLSAKSSKHIVYRDLLLDEEHQTLEVEGLNAIKLTLKEYRLIRHFIKNPEKCLDRCALIDFVWNGIKVSSRTVDSSISRIRKYLENSQTTIESIYGGGYVLR